MFWDHELKAILGEEAGAPAPINPSERRSHSKPTVFGIQAAAISRKGVSQRVAAASPTWVQPEQGGITPTEQLAQLAAPAGLVHATLLVAFAVMSVLANWYFQLPAAR